MRPLFHPSLVNGRYGDPAAHRQDCCNGADKANLRILFLLRRLFLANSKS